MVLNLLRLLRRQIKAVIPAALFGLALCVAAVAIVPPAYRASSAIVLFNPPKLPERTLANPSIPDEFDNPFVRFGDLSIIVDILVRRLDSQVVKDQLVARGLTGTYEIAANRDFYRGPIIDVAVQSSTSDRAVTEAQLVQDELELQLVTLQKSQGTADKYLIASEPVVDATIASRVITPTLRVLLLALAFGTALTVGVGLLSDTISKRRAFARREGTRAREESDSEPVPDGGLTSA